MDDEGLELMLFPEPAAASQSERRPAPDWVYVEKELRRGIVSRLLFFFSSRRRHTRFKCDWSSDVCSSDLAQRVGSRLLCLPSRTVSGRSREPTRCAVRSAMPSSATCGKCAPGRPGVK